MNVCVIRNAEAKSNSDIIRSIDAFTTLDMNPVLLTRSRKKRSNNKKIIITEMTYKKSNIQNHEIQLESEMDTGINNIFKLFKYQCIVLMWLFRNRNLYSVVHSYDLDSGLPTLLICFILKKPYVYHISDFYVESRGGIPTSIKKMIRGIEYLVINNANTTIICTEERKEQINGSKPKQLYVIHNSPVNNSNYNIENNNNILKIVYVGGLINVRFIKPVLEVISKKEEYILEIAGIGPLSDLAKKYSEEFVNINYLGEVSYEKALELYKNSDIMFAIYDPAVPNHKYSAPNKVYEAMMLGKPIIVARETGVDKIVEKEKMGFIIEYSKNEFEKILDYISNNKKILDRTSLNSKNAYEKYSWEKMKEKYKEIYAPFMGSYLHEK